MVATLARPTFVTALAASRLNIKRARSTMPLRPGLETPTTGQLWPRGVLVEVPVDPSEPPPPIAPVINKFLTNVDGSSISYSISAAAGDVLLVHVMHRGALTSIPAGLAQVGATQSHLGGTSDAYTQWSSVFTKAITGTGTYSGTFTQNVTQTGGPPGSQAKMAVQAYTLRDVAAVAQAAWVAQTDREDLALSVPADARTVLLMDTVVGGTSMVHDPEIAGFTRLSPETPGRISAYYGISDGTIEVVPGSETYDIGVLAVTLA